MKVNRARLRQVATITLEHEEEDLDWRTHFEDPQDTTWVQKELQAGNDWAWCCAHVVAEHRGLKAETWLGACSYESRENFRDGEYFTNMVDEVIEELADRIEALFDVHGLLETEGTLCLQCLVL